MTTPLPVYAKGATISFPAAHTAGGSDYRYGVRAATYVGAEVSAPGSCPTCTADWLTYDASTFSSALMADKQFYSPGQPIGTWAEGHNRRDQEASIPPAVLQLVCFDDPKTTPAQVTAYVKSIPAGKPVAIIFQQEYEHSSWATPSAFFTWFGSLSAAVRSVGNPAVMVCADSAGSAYEAGGKGAGGKWIVPPDLVDAYGADMYENRPQASWPKTGLAGDPKFPTWLGYVAHSGKKLMIPEYGICATGSDQQRHDRIAMDAAYLLSAAVPAFYAWLYWWSDCTAAVLSTTPGKQHQFHDQPTIDLWTSICQGTF